MNVFKDKHLPNNHLESRQEVRAHTHLLISRSSESHTPAPPQKHTGKHPKFPHAAVTGGSVAWSSSCTTKGHGFNTSPGGTREAASRSFSLTSMMFPPPSLKSIFTRFSDAIAFFITKKGKGGGGEDKEEKTPEKPLRSRCSGLWPGRQLAHEAAILRDGHGVHHVSDAAAKMTSTPESHVREDLP